MSVLQSVEGRDSSKDDERTQSQTTPKSHEYMLRAGSTPGWWDRPSVVYRVMMKK